MLESIQNLTVLGFVKEIAIGLFALAASLSICYSIQSKHKLFSKMLAVLGDALTANVMVKVEQLNSNLRKDVKEDITVLETNLSDARKDSEDRYERTQAKLEQMSEDFRMDLQTQYNEVVTFIAESEATQARYRILRFNDEIIENRRHSKEHFDQILEMIDNYESYCANHPNYENSKCIAAIENIHRVYQECIQTGDF